ncbi:MAG: phosphoenolpyruvate carboxykinase (ATP), partial [Sporosarcina sp.]
MISAKISDDLNKILSGENVHIQLSVPQLVEKAVTRGEAKLTSDGAVTAQTGKYTGRSPKDKYIVEEASSKDKIDWGSVN